MRGYGSASWTHCGDQLDQLFRLRPGIFVLAQVDRDMTKLGPGWYRSLVLYLSVVSWYGTCLDDYGGQTGRDSASFEFDDSPSSPNRNIRFSLTDEEGWYRIATTKNTTLEASESSISWVPDNNAFERHRKFRCQSSDNSLVPVQGAFFEDCEALAPLPSPTPKPSGKKLFSFSVYRAAGNDINRFPNRQSRGPRFQSYIGGMIQNIQLIKDWLPGWSVRVYLDTRCSFVTEGSRTSVLYSRVAVLRCS